MHSMTTTLLTADEYIAMGESWPRTQLINGEVIVNNPTIRHQEIVTFIHLEIRSWMPTGPGRGRSPGQIDVKMDGTNVYAPEVLWFSEGRLPADGTHFDGAPDLVVEVRSASTWRYDTTTKFQKYEMLGVAELWMVDTASTTVFVYRRSAPGMPTFDIALELGEGALVTPLLPELTIDIATLFDR
jgi:Uma2 family endonuclease